MGRLSINLMVRAIPEGKYVTIDLSGELEKFSMQLGEGRDAEYPECGL